MKYLYLIFVVVIVFTACNQQADKQTNSKELMTNYKTEELENTEKTIKKVFFNLPSPIELTQTILSANHTFNTELLNSVDNISKYNSSTKKSLNFGIYGADLCYCRVYEQLQESINYLSAIRQISDELQIPEEEGSKTIDRIEKNLNNRDSVFDIIADTYAEADGYLKENERDETATYILVGGWVEGMYFATSIAKENPEKEDIINRIAEQKYSLENLILLISDYVNSPVIKDIMPNLKKLNGIYENIDISYDKPVIVTDKETNVTTINNKTEILITNEQIQEITKIIENIRSIIIN